MFLFFACNRNICAWKSLPRQNKKQIHFALVACKHKCESFNLKRELLFGNAHTHTHTRACMSIGFLHLSCENFQNYIIFISITVARFAKFLHFHAGKAKKMPLAFRSYEKLSYRKLNLEIQFTISMDFRLVCLFGRAFGFFLRPTNTQTHASQRQHFIWSTEMRVTKNSWAKPRKL